MHENNLDEVYKWTQLHRPKATDKRQCGLGNLKFLCTLNTPSLERWPAQCWRIRTPNLLGKTTTPGRPSWIVICDGTEKASRPCTQLEIPIRLRRLNSRARIYKEWYANHWRLEPSGFIMNQRAPGPTLQIPCSHHHIPSTTSVITSRGPYQLEGARWHLLNKVFSIPESFGADLHSELRLQERLDENLKHISFSWQVLRKASEIFRAKP